MSQNLVNRTFAMPDRTKVHVTLGITPDNFRSTVVCVIETKFKKFYSGVAVLSPNETDSNEKRAVRLALNRACLSITGWTYRRIANDLCRKIWHEIRNILRIENGGTNDEQK